LDGIINRAGLLGRTDEDLRNCTVFGERKEKKIGIAHARAKKIIVLNLKGGVGKSTFSAGLISQLIENDNKVELIDFDNQQSTYGWAENIADVPCQSYNPAMRSMSSMGMTLRVNANSDYIIMDSPANFSEPELTRYLRYADYIIIPMQPSPVDLHASLPFINTLIEKHLYKRSNIKLGFVINRCFQRDDKLKRVMSLLNIFSQFQTLGVMSESDCYQEAFHYKQLMKIEELDKELWDGTLNWLR
jgi:chromosome partitioning protein